VVAVVVAALAEAAVAVVAAVVDVPAAVVLVVDRTEPLHSAIAPAVDVARSGRLPCFITFRIRL